MSACGVFQFYLDLFKENGRYEKRLGSLCVSHFYCFIKMVVSRRGMSLPPQNSDIEWVAENVADCSAVKWVSAGGADAACIKHTGNFWTGASS